MSYISSRRALMRGAQRLSKAQQLMNFFGGEQQGLAIDFTDQSALVKDSTTAANNYASTGTVLNGALRGPGGLLAYSANSPSPKMVLLSNGNFGFNPHNLLKSSNKPSTGQWTQLQSTVVDNAGTAPDGTLTASTITATAVTNYHYVKQVFSASFNWVYTVYVKYVNNAWVFFSAADDTQLSYFNVQTGVFGTNLSTDLISHTATAVGSGWYRVTLAVSGARTGASSGISVGVAQSDGVGSFAAAGTEQVLMWHASVQGYPQIDTAVYVDVPSTTPQFSLPYEWNTSGVCQGILVEEQRSNLALQSNTFSNASWTAHDLTNATTTTTGPDGVSTSATQINEDTVNTQHYFQQVFTKAASALAYTFTVFGKVGTGRTRISVRMDDGANGTSFPFDLSGGQVGTTSNIGTGFTSTSSSIVALPNGFYRCIMTGTSTTSTNLTLTIFSDNGSGTSTASQTFAGTIGNGCYIYNAQLEQASYVTSALGGSPIITGSASVTRAADQVTLASTNFPSMTTACTSYAKFMNSTAAQALSAVSVISLLSDGGTLNNRVETYTTGNPQTTMGYFANSGGVTQINQTFAALLTAGSTGKSAWALSASDARAAYNGALQTDGGAITMPTGITVYSVGYLNGAANQANTYIQQLALWPRAFANAQLTAVST